MRRFEPIVYCMETLDKKPARSQDADRIRSGDREQRVETRIMLLAA